jgi:hypothetical protein
MKAGSPGDWRSGKRKRRLDIAGAPLETTYRKIIAA